ncbi:dihydrofolate reductase family protein [Alkalibacterium sp. f15]|uniref:dihydrofolate reductase family protein n=1 Tax=Alkalibacterium sp. f15 TaxID=3414029 RepID=UPI003BF7FD9A
MTKEQKVMLFTASSLDGYIATKDESLEWLFNVEGEGDNGISEFYNDVDTVVMGKTTYDWIMRNDPTNFPDKDCYVFTHSSLEDENVTFINETPSDFISRMKVQERRKIWLVGGGKLVHSFLKENLIDELIITIAPVILGTGIPLFNEEDYYFDLSLKRLRQFNQFVELHYVVKK